jgi:hypothetical protein
MRVDETGNPTRFDEEGHEIPGAWPDAPSEDGHIPQGRVVTSSGEAVTGGVSTGAADRKQPDTWARRYGTANNLGPGALNMQEEE